MTNPNVIGAKNEGQKESVMNADLLSAIAAFQMKNALIAKTERITTFHQLFHYVIGAKKSIFKKTALQNIVIIVVLISAKIAFPIAQIARTARTKT
jgi:hypothetical protein